MVGLNRLENQCYPDLVSPRMVALTVLALTRCGANTNATVCDDFLVKIFLSLPANSSNCLF